VMRFVAYADLGARSREGGVQNREGLRIK